MRATVGIGQLRQAAQVVVLHGGRRTGDRLTGLWQQVAGADGEGFVQDVVLRGDQFVGCERAAVGATVRAHIAGIAQHIHKGFGHMIVGVDAVGGGIGVGIAAKATDGVQGVDRARGGVAAQRGTRNARMARRAKDGRLAWQWADPAHRQR